MIPFQHWVIDDFLPADRLRSVLAEWPDPKEMSFKVCSTSVKAHCTDWSKFGPTTKAMFNRLNSQPFLSYLEKLTGFSDLIADPDIKGGGLHEIPPGGFLNMHVDFNWNRQLQAARTLNLLIYLNEDWKWNGELVLSKDGTEKTKVIEPIFGRCVIFPTTENSWHGHPEPLTAPRSRKSLALYYYRKEDRPVIHSTVYA
jgi:Rps23 Pro-64 3,4-dihydroxylase Tpa1-like proline 4-hydroxylase